MARTRLVKLLIISDTHLPGRGRSLPRPVWRAVEEVDVVVHAGDWVAPNFSTSWRATPDD